MREDTMSPHPDHIRAPDLRPRYALAGLGAVGLATLLWRRRRTPYDLSQRTVIVTGGVRGLGLLLARELGRAGARLFVVSRTSEDVACAEACLRAEGIDATGFVCDVRDRHAVAGLVSQVVSRTGRIDIIVNNAGVIAAAPFEQAQLEDFAASLDTHFWGPLYLVREALPHLRRAGDARILNISSIGGRVAVPHLAAYAAGKFALVGLSEGLRAELRKDGILVTTATPGLMRTGSHVKVRLRGQHAKEARWFGAAVATPLTSMNACRAARQIVRACCAGRAHVTPGIQARMATLINALMPELAASASALVAGHLLPGPSSSPEGHRTRIAGDVGFGWLSPLLPTPAARNL